MSTYKNTVKILCNILVKYTKDGLAFLKTLCYNKVAYTYICLSAAECGKKDTASKRNIL